MHRLSESNPTHTTIMLVECESMHYSGSGSDAGVARGKSAGARCSHACPSKAFAPARSTASRLKHCSRKSRSASLAPAGRRGPSSCTIRKRACAQRHKSTRRLTWRTETRVRRSHGREIKMRRPTRRQLKNGAPAWTQGLGRQAPQLDALSRNTNALTMVAQGANSLSALRTNKILPDAI